MIFDRIYGKLSFPNIIRELLNCPGLLRLREVRMSNVPFINFPSFYFVNRFEHSFGVCYLAQLASEAINLSPTEKTEFMCACLYHDVATPPFAHVTEQIMSECFGFDHEKRLRDLLVGSTEDLGMEKSQVFLGKSLKLPKIVQSKEGRRLGLDIFRIADMTVGKGRLGSLVKGDIDLDNIDNVIRAATAMGIRICGGRDAEMLARAFRVMNMDVFFDQSSLNLLKKWQRARYALYDAIYGDIEDFSLETMLKCAVRLLLETDSDVKLLPIDWCLTDEQLVHHKIMRDRRAKEIMIRVRLCDYYPCVGVFSLSGSKSFSFVTQRLSEIEQVATEYFKVECVANYTLDKRHRPVTRPLLSFFSENSTNLNLDKEKRTQKTLLAIFSTDKRKYAYSEPDPEFSLRLQSLVPKGIDLKPIKIVSDKYPRLIEIDEWS